MKKVHEIWAAANTPKDRIHIWDAINRDTQQYGKNDEPNDEVTWGFLRVEDLGAQ